jgi:type IV secretory pathway VirB10-like protein
VIAYGEQDGNRRYGLIVAIAVHVLLVAIWYFQPTVKPQHAAARSGEAIVWLPPLAPTKPTTKPKAEAAPKAAKPSAPSRVTPPRVTQVKRLPNTITLPKEKPVQDPPPPPPKEVAKVEPEVTDMQAYIDAKRKARGAPSQSDSTEESQSAKGMRNALANIGAINGRGGQDPNETGGVFSVSNKTFNSADVKFRGWNPNFKRRWLTAVTVERGSEPDIETAIVKKMIELIRKEKTGDFEWDSHRLNRVVTLSARPQDTQELIDFLFKEMFPEYRPPRKGG